MQSSVERRNARQVFWASHSYMRPEAEQKYETENYVASPPAARITDAGNNVWTLGYKYLEPSNGAPRGEFAFIVLRNMMNTGEYASRIERRHGKIRIFTRNGWKLWNGRNFV